jgi:hypothetical protein
MKKCLAPMFATIAMSCAAALAVASDEPPVQHPELLAGAWETAGAAGIDGIFLSIRTHVQGATTQSETSSQDVQIRLYHREADKETGGWYVAGSGAVFDGNRLQLHAVSDGPVIDVVFDPVKHRWTGTWTRAGKSQDVILDRPHAQPGAVPNVFVGDWEGLPDPVGPSLAVTRLHIYESGDGALTAWIDRVIAPIDQRHGELLQVIDRENRAITLETTSAAGMRYRFHGTLSADGSALIGMWPSATGMGGRLNAATSFRRIQ